MGNRQGGTCHLRRHAYTLSIIRCTIFVLEMRESVVVGLLNVANRRCLCYHHLVGSKIISHQPIGSDRCLHTIRKIDRVNRRCELSSSHTTTLRSIKHNNDNEKSDSSFLSNASLSTNQDADSSYPAVEPIEKEKSGSKKWQANDFDNDRRLLEIAIARESAMSDLQQQQRKYTLDYGFARNRRPLVRDVVRKFTKIAVWMIFLRSVCEDSAFDGNIASSLRDSWNRPYPSTLRKLHILAVKSIFTFTTLHHWIGIVVLPLLLLVLVKFGTLGPDERTMDEYSTYKPGLVSYDRSSFSFSSSEFSRQRSKNKDTGNFVLCLLENWSSAVIFSLAMRLYSMIASLRMPTQSMSPISKIYTLARLITRLGAAAALHQYPSLLFELKRKDRPRPNCRSLIYMQRADKVLFEFLPLGIASDFALLLGKSRPSSGTVELGTAVALLVSILPPLCHLIALGKILRISRCSAVSLSVATVFPPSADNVNEDALSIDNNQKQVKWRFQLRWRTPQRLLETMRTWRNYFFTGHVPLLLEMDEWKKQPILFDDFSTEGTQYKFRDLLPSRGTLTMSSGDSENDDCMPDTAAIAESLSLILRDRDVGIRNATQARLIKHKESYDAKTFDDVLGVAVQQTFGIGLSYDFDHFDDPIDDAEVSLHQLRARLAKSAVRRKLELDNAIRNELDVLHRLKNDVLTPLNKEVAESEMKTVEQGIRERYADEIDRMKRALCALIPTNADAPKGTDRYDSPILIAQYVDLKVAPTKQGEFKVTKEVGSDPMSVIEDFVRKDFGDKAADAYRRDEIAARQKEKEMLSDFRRRYGEMIEDGDRS